MDVQIAQLTDTGRKRRHNEDYVGSWTPDDPAELARLGGLYVVADGVGGAAAGEVASRYAVEKTLHCYFHGQAIDLTDRLIQAIGQANRDIFCYNESHPDRREMGTTIVAAVIRQDELIIAHVGDSRAYLVRNGEINQLTRDHTTVAGMVRSGTLTPEEAADHPWRNQLSRAVGTEPEIQVDISSHQLQMGDTILLCTDGLTKHVTDQEIAQVLSRHSPDDATHELVQRTNEAGGTDNIGLVIARLARAKRRLLGSFFLRTLGRFTRREVRAPADLDETVAPKPRL